MDEKLKKVIEHAEKQRRDKLHNDSIIANELAEKQKKREDEISKIAAQWIEQNIYTMVENAILRGDNSVRISRLEWPKGLTYNVSCEILAKAANNKGLSATLELDEIIIKWSI